MPTIDVTTQYPYSDDYEYVTTMERINMDEERAKDLSTDNGFVIWPPHGIKKDLKDPNGLFSNKFGQTLKDLTPFANRYRCNCGYLTGRLNSDSICPLCETKVRYVDDNFEYFGWLVLNDPHYIIHPNLFKSLESFLGKNTLDNIIHYQQETDADGYIVERKESGKSEPFAGIGILEFRERFDEIMEYYGRSFSNQSKKDYYDDIMKNKDKIFIQSIPVYTTILRPVDTDQNSLYYEDSNKYYNMMNKLVSDLNNYHSLKMNQKKQSNYEMLYNLQTK